MAGLGDLVAQVREHGILGDAVVEAFCQAAQEFGQMDLEESLLFRVAGTFDVRELTHIPATIKRVREQ